MNLPDFFRHIIFFFAITIFTCALFSNNVYAQADTTNKHAHSTDTKSMDTKRIYSFTMKTIDGYEKPLSDYEGKVLLIVNVASECGNTPQYASLQKLYEQYQEKGLRILAFPANNFGQQEPGTDQQIKEFCTTTYHVAFDLFSKISVKGDDQHPIYKYITTESDFKGPVRWNFQKYIADQQGRIVARFADELDPLDTSIVIKIEDLLQKN